MLSSPTFAPLAYPSIIGSGKLIQGSSSCEPQVTMTIMANSTQVFSHRSGSSKELE